MKKIVLLSLSVFAAFSLSAQQPRDWAQYGRYEQQNAALAGESVEVVFMGNSITDNWIGADPDFFARNGFVDRGISGQTTAEMLARFRRDVIDLNPKAVVILAGINDIAQNNGAIKLENVFGNICLDVRTGQIQRDPRGALLGAALRPVFVAPRDQTCGSRRGAQYDAQTVRRRT